MRFPWIWTVDDDLSDLVGPAASLGDRRLLRYPESSGSINLSIPSGTTTSLWLWSPSNQPGQSEWPVGSFDIQCWVLAANPNITVRLTSLFRCDGFGTPIELYAPSGSDLSCGTTGSRRWQGTTLAPAIQPSAGDRLRAGFTFVHNGAKGSLDVTIGFGDPARDYVQVPILMANPQIVWNGNTLAFPGPLTHYQWRLRSDRDLTVSSGCVVVTGHRSAYDEVRAQLGNFEDATFAAALRAWWAWARRGGQYSFALDSADVVNLAMSGAAAAGQPDVPLASTASIVVGRRYLLREAAGDEEETIKVLSVTANVKLTADANLKFGYLTGDIVRSLDYFPKMVSLDSDLPLDQIITTFALDHLMREDKG